METGPMIRRSLAVGGMVVCALVLSADVGADAPAQQPRSGLWYAVAESQLTVAGRGERRPTPSSYRLVGLNREELSGLLGRAPRESAAAVRSQDAVMEMPWPDGAMRRFRIEESPIMAPELAAQFPDVKTYRGQGIDDPTASVRFDWTPQGFHAQVLSADGVVYVDPYAPGNTTTYISYFRRDYVSDEESFRCEVTGEDVRTQSTRRDLDAYEPAHGNAIRTYRLAVGATGEYTAFFGGTVAGAMGGIVTTVNRVNGIYERDLAVRMVLVANNASIVYTDEATDPYTDGEPLTLLCENPVNLDAVIGASNYDIGHVFSTGGGGLASLRSVCEGARMCGEVVGSGKALGVTGIPSPTGDAFDIDYVAHEMGHQFGANHTFNGTSGSCLGNRNFATAFEPGSGSTIMSYAGICAAEDLQPHSDPYFHTGSLTEMISFVTNPATGASCGTPSATANTIPTVNAGLDYTIPAGTPFTLTGSAGDADGDTLTYTWEQLNAGSPTFRSFPPTASPSRTFPRLSEVLSGVSVFGESLPSPGTLNFRVTVRDNRAGGGGTGTDDAVVTVLNTAPFWVTAPNTAVSWASGSPQTITWNVAGTSVAPVNVANVRISLSTNGGLTFPLVLLQSTPNDGSASVTLPDVITSQARIKVEALGNVFFDVSDTDFAIGTAACGLLAPGIVDGNFEVGGPTEWPAWDEASTIFGTPICTTTSCGGAFGFSGSFAWFGGIEQPETASIGQTVTLPASANLTLRFQMRVGRVSFPFTDTLVVSVDGTPLATFTEPVAAEPAFTLREVDLSAFADGAPHNLSFLYTGATAGIANYFVDNIDILSCPTFTAPPREISIGDVSVAEGTGGMLAAVFPVTLSAPRSDSVTVQFTTSNGTAFAPSDFTAMAGTVTFPPGTTSRTIAVPIVADATDEPHETFTLTLSSPTNATIADAQATAVILDDDATPPPMMSVDKTTLNFGGVIQTIKGVPTLTTRTAAQRIRLTQTGNGTVTWTATASQPWLQVVPSSGTGSANLDVSVITSAPVAGAASISFSFGGAGNTAGSVVVNLTPTALPATPFGVVDTPARNADGLTGTVPFTGWALDDVEVTGVALCRAAAAGEFAPVDPRCGSQAQIYVGNGVFIDGARPDLALAAPLHPLNTRAGWGFAVLTNMLPNQGNGAYTFFFYLTDREGHTTLLDTRTVTCNNAGSLKPFGAIDTPAQGETISGAAYVNFGWALTPMPKTIPTDGSTINVFIDGAPVGTVNYNHFRTDIATLFPDLHNTNGAIGFRVIDTTALSNGLHTIAWGVTDDSSQATGVGSRFFTVSNADDAVVSGFTETDPVASGLSRTASAASGAGQTEPFHRILQASLPTEVNAAPLGARAILGRRGWNLNSPLRRYRVGGGGVATIQGEELDRFELHLKGTPQEGAPLTPDVTGYMRVGSALNALPIGSYLDPATGVFAWHPGVGFVGAYDLVFVRWADGRALARQEVRIVINPKGSGRVGPQVVVDAPRMLSDVGRTFYIGGWAADLDAESGTGISTLHVWAYPASGGRAFFLGVPVMNAARSDVAAVYGGQFRDTGWGLVVRSLPPGVYDLAVFGLRESTGAFLPAKVVRVRVQ